MKTPSPLCADRRWPFLLRGWRSSARTWTLNWTPQMHCVELFGSAATGAVPRAVGRGGRHPFFDRRRLTVFTDTPAPARPSARVERGQEGAAAQVLRALPSPSPVPHLLSTPHNQRTSARAVSAPSRGASSAGCALAGCTSGPHPPRAFSAPAQSSHMSIQFLRLPIYAY